MATNRKLIHAVKIRMFSYTPRTGILSLGTTDILDHIIIVYVCVCVIGGEEMSYMGCFGASLTSIG